MAPTWELRLVEGDAAIRKWAWPPLLRDLTQSRPKKLKLSSAGAVRESDSEHRPVDVIPQKAT